jgi:hypothetical protein
LHRIDSSALTLLPDTLGKRRLLLRLFLAPKVSPDVSRVLRLVDATKLRRPVACLRQRHGVWLGFVAVNVERDEDAITAGD